MLVCLFADTSESWKTFHIYKRLIILFFISESVTGFSYVILHYIKIFNLSDFMCSLKLKYSSHILMYLGGKDPAWITILQVEETGSMMMRDDEWPYERFSFL